MGKIKLFLSIIRMVKILNCKFFSLLFYNGPLLDFMTDDIIVIIIYCGGPWPDNVHARVPDRIMHIYGSLAE